MQCPTALREASTDFSPSRRAAHSAKRRSAVAASHDAHLSSAAGHEPFASDVSQRMPGPAAGILLLSTRRVLMSNQLLEAAVPTLFGHTADPNTHATIKLNHECMSPRPPS